MEISDTDKYEEMEMYTGSMCLASGEKDFYECIGYEKKQQWETLRSKHCNNSFTTDAYSNFLSPTCCAKHNRKQKKPKKRELGLLEEEFRFTELSCFCKKTYCCSDSLKKKSKFNSRGQNKRTIEDSENSPMARNEKVYDRTEQVTSTNHGFRTKNHCVATYEPTKNESPIFILNKELSQMESIFFQCKFKRYIYDVVYQICIFQLTFSNFQSVFVT